MVLLSSLAAPLSAQVTIGYFTDGNTSVTDPAAGIETAGATPLQFFDIAEADFNLVQKLVINNSSNTGYSPALLSRAADLEAWVRSGGILIFHDRFVGSTDGVHEHNSLLPGVGSAEFVRSFTLDDDIDFTGSNFINNGPFGILDDTSLDGGNSSTHGFVRSSTLPLGTHVFFTVGDDPGKAAGFGFTLDAGIVYYSTIPLDHYLAGSGPEALVANLQDIYYPNLLSGVTAIPEPSTWALMGLGVAAILVFRRWRSP